VLQSEAVLIRGHQPVNVPELLPDSVASRLGDGSAMSEEIIRFYEPHLSAIDKRLPIETVRSI
jgi:hypothetical protein